MIGKTISHYKIIEKIGAGGMGVIYRAQDLKLDRFVALKFLPPHLTTSDEEKQRFIHEAKAASSLDHNNICNIYEIDETEDGQLFISMACYEGETLDNKIKDKPLPIDEATDIAIQIAQGLAIAHEKEIIHRDIKPANIMLTRESVVKVLDFGLAKLSTQTKLTKESTTLGTVSYMSPEQAKGEDIDHRTDIWSLGVILYEMITGQLPFKGEYESAVIYSILNDTQEPVTGLRTGILMELERIINKCLQKSPGERYQHMDELVVDLKGLKSKSSGITTELTMKKRFKSVLIPISIALVIILMVVSFLLIPPAEENGTGWENSIAVLYFGNISNDPEQEYFCEGMTEQIISNLAKLRKLKVISRTSVMKYKATDKTIPEIGNELNVAYILEGSVRKFGDRIRVTAQLIDTEDDFHIWTENYDREYKELFEVQDEVSEAIATNLLANLSPQEKKEIKTNRPKSTEAYEYLLRGKSFFNKFISTSLDKTGHSKTELEKLNLSEEMFKKAIKIDPDFSDSYANLGEVYHTFYSIVETEEERPKYMKLQETYLDTAYQLDPNSADVNYLKGLVHSTKIEDDEAINSFKTAIKLNPNNDIYYNELGLILHYKGLSDVAIKCCNKAIELNPVNPFYYQRRGLWYALNRENDNAEKDLRKAIEIDKNNFPALNRYWYFLYDLKRYDEAEKLLTQMTIDYPNERMELEYAFTYASKGEKEKAMNIFKSQENWESDEFNLGALYSILGMKDEAINLLTKASDRKIKRDRSWYFILITMHDFDNLRSDPRFQEILAKHKELYEENLEKYGDIDI